MHFEVRYSHWASFAHSKQYCNYAHRKSAGEIEMEGNLAYGHVSTGQVGESGGEEVYDNL